MPSAGLRLLEVLVMDGRNPERGVYALSYYSWISGFEHAIFEELMSDIGAEPTVGSVIMSSGGYSQPDEPEGVLLHTLAPVMVDGATGGGALRSNRLPSVVANVAAEAQSATTLIEQVFVSIFPADLEAVTPHVSATRYDENGEPDLLDLFSVAVLSGRPNYSGRRVLFKGGIPLEDLVAGSPQELRKVHEGLHSRVDRYLRRGNP